MVGLGNPGPRYAETRHNVGFSVVELLSGQLDLRLKRSWTAPWIWGRRRDDGLILVQPLTWMNRSGDVLPRLFRRTGTSPSDLLVVTDNLDLPPGRCRLKSGGSSAGHNGLKSIIDVLGTGDFLRLYVGVGHPGRRSRVVDHVLGRPEGEERDMWRQGLRVAAEAVLSLRNQPVREVMNELNRREG